MRVDGQISGGTRRSVMSRKGYEMDTLYVQLETRAEGSFTPTTILQPKRYFRAALYTTMIALTYKTLLRWGNVAT